MTPRRGTRYPRREPGRLRPLSRWRRRHTGWWGEVVSWSWTWRNGVVVALRYGGPGLGRRGRRGEQAPGRGGCGLGLAGRLAEVGTLLDRHQPVPTRGGWVGERRKCEPPELTWSAPSCACREADADSFQSSHSHCAEQDPGVCTLLRVHLSGLLRHPGQRPGAVGVLPGPAGLACPADPGEGEGGRGGAGPQRGSQKIGRGAGGKCVAVRVGQWVWSLAVHGGLHGRGR